MDSGFSMSRMVAIVAISTVTLAIVIVLGVLSSSPAAAAADVAASNLNPGDIAIVGFNMDAPDRFAFVLLANISAGTQITFTDNGWMSPENTFLTGENQWVWTAESTRCAGTVITTDGLNGLSASGDQILAYQGSESSPVFLNAVNDEGSGWQATASSSNTSARPPGLSSGSTALALVELDNYVYVGPTTATAAQLRTTIHTASNWSGSDTISQIFPTGFTVTDAGPCTGPRPTVVSTTPTDAAGGIAVNSDIIITFSEDVTVSGAWFQMSCTTSGTVNVSNAVVSGGPQMYTINPIRNLANHETCLVTLFANGIRDDDMLGLASNYTFLFTTIAGVIATDVTINEIRIDQAGTDNNEYFELAGEPGTLLDGLTYLVIGDSSANLSGNLEEAVDLSGLSIPADGYFLAAEDTLSPTLGSADLVSNLDFENGDNVTHMLVSGFFGATNSDLDVNDDGSLDVEPWTTILDAVGIVASTVVPAETEHVYGAALGFVDIGPEPADYGNDAPSHIFRYPNRTGNWIMGTHSLAESTRRDTPGKANLLAPHVVSLSAVHAESSPIFLLSAGMLLVLTVALSFPMRNACTSQRF